MSAQDEVVDLLPCPFCDGKVMFRKALWPTDGCTDAIIHAAPSGCGLIAFEIETNDGSVIAAWNRRAAICAMRSIPLSVLVAGCRALADKQEELMAAHLTGGMHGLARTKMRLRWEAMIDALGAKPHLTNPDAEEGA